MAVEDLPIPDDPALLRRFTITVLEELRENRKLVAKLTHEIELFRRHLYGRRSETIDPAQLALAFPQIRGGSSQEIAISQAIPTVDGDASKPARRKGHGRRAVIPALLPRNRIEHTLAEAECRCEECGSRLQKIGEEITEQLDYTPASLFVNEHVRFKYACKRCEGHLAIAELPGQPIDKGLPGPGLLAQVSVSKFADHLPLNRQVGIFQRHGVELSRSTLCGWIGYVAELLTPLYEDLKRFVLEGRVIQTDDTLVPVLDEALRQTRKGRLWVYVGDRQHRATVFHYTPTRCREGPAAFLGVYSGYMQADAYAGYDALYKAGTILEVGCMAHARRYFFDAKETDARALIALAYIHELYEVEKIAPASDPVQRKALREKHSKPTIEGFKTWLDAQALEVLPKSPIGEAVDYARKQWTVLTRYLDDGSLEIDNSASERALRKVVVGRANWLFCGSDEGGRRAAILYSIIATCRDHQVEPFAYLRDVLARIPTHPDRRRAELLPMNWKAHDATRSQ
jgi:transposase